jgi:hypothetical protein
MVKKLRTQIDMKTFNFSHRHPRSACLGWAMSRSPSFASSQTVSATFFAATQMTTTNGDSALSTPRPLAFVRLVKVKRLLSAPPVKQHP